MSAEDRLSDLARMVCAAALNAQSPEAMVSPDAFESVTLAPLGQHLYLATLAAGDIEALRMMLVEVLSVTGLLLSMAADELGRPVEELVETTLAVIEREQG